MTLYTQWVTMSVMFTSGCMLGILLDLVHVFRDRFQFRKWLQPIIDLVYWLLSAILVFGLLWWSNWGELRFYIFVAICLGFFVYFKYLSERARKILWHMIRLFEWIIRGVLDLIDVIFWKPFKKIFMMLRAILFGLVFIPLSLVKKWFGLFFKKNREKK